MSRISQEVGKIEKRLLGWKKDKFDARDYKMKLSPPDTKIPDKVDLRSQFPPVYNQDLSDCTANASVGGICRDLMQENLPKDNSIVTLSRLFQYYNSRLVDQQNGDGSTNDDNGSYLRSALSAANKYGVCSEKLWPYEDTSNKYKIEPSKSAYEDAKKYKVDQYFRVGSLFDAKVALSHGYPIVCGIPVYSECFETEIAKTHGVIPNPPQNKTLEGGHAICLVGFSTSDGVFIFRNSWSSSWGDGGYGYLSDGYMKEADDLWAIVHVTDPSSVGIEVIVPSTGNIFAKIWNWIKSIFA